MSCSILNVPWQPFIAEQWMMYFEWCTRVMHQGDIFLASVGMDGVDSVSKPIRFSKPYRFTKSRHHIKRKFYKRVIPSGFIRYWISSHPSEGCPKDGVGSHWGVAYAVWGVDYVPQTSAPLFSLPRRGIGMGLIEMSHSFQRTEETPRNQCFRFNYHILIE